MQLRTWCAALVLLCLCAAVYRVADHVESRKKELRQVNAQIANEGEALRVLSAEWTYLTNPARLEKLAVSYLKLQPMDGRQYIAASAIPLRNSFDMAEGQQPSDIQVHPVSVRTVVAGGAP
jgi:cell division protein FtsL